MKWLVAPISEKFGPTSIALAVIRPSRRFTDSGGRSMAELAIVGKAIATTRAEPFASASVLVTERTRPLRLRFGCFELDPKSGEMTGTQGRVVLQWQPLQLLLMLIDRPGEMVTRDEIRQRLWGEDVIVDFDHSINQLARKLRRALGDSAKAPTYIESLARRGYRLKVPVELLEKPAAAAQTIEFSAGKLPERWNGQDAGKRAASGRSSWLRLRELAGAAEPLQPTRGGRRCRFRSPRNSEEFHDRLTPLVHTISQQVLQHCVSAATPAERLDAVRQFLILVAQILEGASV